MYKPSQEVLDLHAADVAEAAERGKLLDAARAAKRRKQKNLAEGTGVVPTKYPPKVKLKIFS